MQIVSAQGTLRLYNIYNDCTNDETLEALRAHLIRPRSARGLPRPIRYVWMGDFNRHSPMWDEPRNHHLFTRGNLDAAGKLIDMAAEFGMSMVLPAKMATLEASASGNRTTRRMSVTLRVFEFQLIPQSLKLNDAYHSNQVLQVMLSPSYMLHQVQVIYPQSP